MRKYGRTDANHQPIVDELRKIGARVQSLASVGDGCPDLLVGFRGKNFLLEIKNPEASVTDQRLTKEETEWHATWRGTVCIVLTPQQAINTILKGTP